MATTKKTITILIIGEVNVGKSTLINCIYSDILADAKPIRTTMGINIYEETEEKKAEDPEDIYNKNVKNDTDIIKKVELIEKQQDESEDKDNLINNETIKEVIHKIKPSTDLGAELKKKGYILKIIDTPGFNDSYFDELVYKWLDNNIHKIDIVFLVTNIHTGGIANKCNQDIVKKLFKYKMKKKIDNFFVVLNKCDNPNDDEHTKTKQIVLTTLQKIAKTYKTTFNPEMCLMMSAQKAYLYRYIIQKQSFDGLNEKEKELLIRNELGARAIRYKEETQLAKLTSGITNGDTLYKMYFGEMLFSFDKYIINRAPTIYKNKTSIKSDKQNKKIPKKIQNDSPFERIVNLVNEFYLLENVANDKVILKDKLKDIKKLEDIIVKIRREYDNEDVSEYDSEIENISDNESEIDDIEDNENKENEEEEDEKKDDNSNIKTSLKENVKVTKYKKAKIPKALRDTLWKKYCGDNMKGKCYCCQKEISYQDFHCAHVIPESKGGKTNIYNLRVTCKTCNLSCGQKNLDEFAKQFEK